MVSVPVLLLFLAMPAQVLVVAEPLFSTRIPVPPPSPMTVFPPPPLLMVPPLKLWVPVWPPRPTTNQLLTVGRPPVWLTFPAQISPTVTYPHP